ncbi:MAG: AAA family ATPase [Roseivirga sp.]|nr:AAA family ATPase [Roseivirga sp.]
MKIHILGASGSGTTTLGQALGKHGWKHLDADDYYWVQTDPPFQQKVPLDIRNKRISQYFEASGKVVISGSMFSWGEHWKQVFDLVIFLQLDKAVRMERLRLREESRYGQVIYDDPKRNKAYRAFMSWAEQYDDPTFTGRSLRLHEQWLSELTCPILRLDGADSLEENLNLVMTRLGEI